MPHLCLIPFSDSVLHKNPSEAFEALCHLPLPISLATRHIILFPTLHTSYTATFSYSIQTQVLRYATSFAQNLSSLPK